MKKIIFLSAVIWLACTANAQTTNWQTTHLGNSSFHSSGNCRLEYDKLKITIHPFHIEVEEEAEISAIGTVWSGDSMTLEIVGQFILPKGSAVRSMLLWNGSKLLKAKLRDRAAADSAYEKVVDRDKQVYIPRDPALIEYVADNQYRYKIYPVAINKSRKIRITYSIPLSSTGEFELLTAFTHRFAEYPKTISIEYYKSKTSFERYLTSYGTERKQIQFGSTYLIATTQIPNSFYYSYNRFIIIPDPVKWNNAYSCKIDSGNVSGYYTAIYSSFPDTLKQLITESSVYRYTCEASISAGNKPIITQLPISNVFSIYIKSNSLWNGVISWFVYDNDGNEIIKYDQKLVIDTLIPERDVIPLLWGALYSLSEKSGNLGSLFGFVDNRMSLLALESDSLDFATAVQYSDSGVPLLLPNEIIIDPSKIPSSPKENIIVDYTNIKMITDKLSGMQVYLLAQNMIVIEFFDGLVNNLKVELYDLNGRMVYSWKNVSINGKKVQLKTPLNLKGAYILKLRAGFHSQQQKLILK